jgi:hypothetical protein
MIKVFHDNSKKLEALVNSNKQATVNFQIVAQRTLHQIENSNKIINELGKLEAALKKTKETNHGETDN